MQNISILLLLIRHSLFCILLASLSGCAATFRGAPELPRGPAKSQESPMFLMDKATYDKYETAAPADKKAVRNRIIDERMLEIDYKFYEYEESLWKEGIGSGVGTDWVLLAIDGVTSQVGRETFKAGMGTLGAVIQGGKAAFDKNVYFDRVLPVLLAQMVAEREKVRAKILLSKRLADSDYSLYAAVSHLLEYFEAGTLRGVVEVIAEDAGEKKAEASERIRDTQISFLPLDDTARKIKNFYRPGGSLDKANQKKVLDWLKNNKKNYIDIYPNEITLPSFLRDIRLREAREQMVDELDIP